MCVANWTEGCCGEQESDGGRSAGVIYKNRTRGFQNGRDVRERRDTAGSSIVEIDVVGVRCAWPVGGRLFCGYEPAWIGDAVSVTALPQCQTVVRGEHLERRHWMDDAVVSEMTRRVCTESHLRLVYTG